MNHSFEKQLSQDSDLPTLNRSSGPIRPLDYAKITEVGTETSHMEDNTHAAFQSYSELVLPFH